jgi:hypothetical protein
LTDLVGAPVRASVLILFGALGYRIVFVVVAVWFSAEDPGHFGLLAGFGLLIESPWS